MAEVRDWREVRIPGQASIEICTRNLFSLPIAIRTRQRAKNNNLTQKLFFSALFASALESVYRLPLRFQVLFVLN